jgi:hypothetical protein
LSDGAVWSVTCQRTLRLHFAGLKTFGFVLQSAFYSDYGIRPSHKNSNNALAGEPETENDAACEISFANFVLDFTSVSGGASGDDKKDLFK